MKYDKKETIFQAALSVFAEYGFKKTTIEDIATELGMANGTLYLYAKNKKDLYYAAVRYGFTLWQDRVKQAVSETDDPVEKILVLTHRAYEYLEEDKNLSRILERDPALFPLSPSSDPYSDINNESMSMLRAILSEGIEKGVFTIDNPETAASCLFSIYVMFIQKTYVSHEGLSARKMFEETVNLILKGIITR